MISYFRRLSKGRGGSIGKVMKNENPPSKLSSMGANILGFFFLCGGGNESFVRTNSPPLNVM